MADAHEQTRHGLQYIQRHYGKPITDVCAECRRSAHGDCRGVGCECLGIVCAPRRRRAR